MRSTAVRSVIPVHIVTTAGLAGGFAVAQATSNRALGGVVFAVAGAWSAREWARMAGPATAGALTALYAGAMGGSHPLAKQVGAWPSVAVVCAAVAAASAFVELRSRPS